MILRRAAGLVALVVLLGAFASPGMLIAAALIVVVLTALRA